MSLLSSPARPRKAEQELRLAHPSEPDMADRLEPLARGAGGAGEDGRNEHAPTERLAQRFDPARLVQLFQMISGELESGAFNICVQLIESPRPNNWDYRARLIG